MFPARNILLWHKSLYLTFFLRINFTLALQLKRKQTKAKFKTPTTMTIMRRKAIFKV